PRVRCSAASSRASTTRRPRPFRGCARSCAWRTRWRWSPITCGPPSRASLPSTSAGMKGRTPASAPRTSYGRWPKRRRGRAWSHGLRAMAGAAQKIEAVYELPFLAHATLEPVNCTVHVQPDGCDLWLGTQVPTFTQTAAAKLTGLPRGQVRVHNHLLGGGFGRRL